MYQPLKNSKNLTFIRVRRHKTLNNAIYTLSQTHTHTWTFIHRVISNIAISPPIDTSSTIILRGVLITGGAFFIVQCLIMGLGELLETFDETRYLQDRIICGKWSFVQEPRQGCFELNWRIFKGAFYGISKKLKGCFKKVSLVYRGCFKEVSKGI